MNYLKLWSRNLLVTLAAFVGAGIFMLIFMKIFYPDTSSFLVLVGQFGIQFASALKLWPLIVLAVIVYAMPRPRRRRD